MNVRRGYMLWSGAAVAAASLALSPAFSAASSLSVVREAVPVSLEQLGSIASFTPATQDNRLAAAYAKAVVGGSRKSFRFTPTSGSMSGQRSITVAVRAGDNDAASAVNTAASSGLGITPMAYNLGVSRGWNKFALAEAGARKPLDPIVIEGTLPKAGGFALKSRTKFSTNVAIEGKRDLGTTPLTLAGEKTYSLDVASSYALTRNLNVMAGVRYRGDLNRLAPITDDRKDSQAVYVGTAFRF